MKKILILIILACSGEAAAISDLSFGLYGGINYPIVQEDAKIGPAFGVKLKFSPAPIVGAAAFIETRTYGDPETKIFEGQALERTVRTDGGKLTVFGLEGLLGASAGGIGPRSYAILGIARYKWTRDNYDDFIETAYQLGLGLEIGLPSGLGIEGRAKFEFVPLDNRRSRKNFLGFIGLNYHFGLI